MHQHSNVSAGKEGKRRRLVGRSAGRRENENALEFLKNRLLRTLERAEELGS